MFNHKIVDKYVTIHLILLLKEVHHGREKETRQREKEVTRFTESLK